MAAPKLDALVLCAGEGTRLRPLTLSMPKPLAPVAGEPLLFHTLRWLSSQGVQGVAINLHHLPGAIPQAVGDGRDFGLDVRYFLEEHLLGTAGAAVRLQPVLADTFVVVYGDVLCDADLQPLLTAHRLTGAAATLGVTPVQDDPTRLGVATLDATGRVTAFVEKPDAATVRRLTENGSPLWAASGVCVVQRTALAGFAPGEPCDFGFDVFPQLLAEGRTVLGVPLNGYLLDIGSHQRLAQATADVLAGRVRGARPTQPIAGGTAL